MPLERLHLLAVLQADDVVGKHGFPDGDRRLRLLHDRSGDAGRRERGVDSSDKRHQRLGGYVIMRRMRRDDLRGQLQQ